MKKIFAVAVVLALALCGCKSAVPAAPQKAVAAAGKKITLTWQPVQTPEFFRIYRCEGGAENYRFIDDTTDQTYTDETAAPGKAYRYKITAVSGNSESAGAKTNEVALAVSGGQNGVELKAPTINAVTKMDRYTTVVQFSAGGANCVYQIFRSASVNGAYTQIGTTTEPVWYDETANGRPFYYKVLAQQGQQKTAFSAPCPTGKNAKTVFRVPVMMYHEFVTKSDLNAGVAFDEYAIWQTEFEQDLIWLKQNGYTTITCRQLAEYMEGKNQNLPAKPILLTADDGKYGVYKNAYPLLKKYGATLSLALIGYEIDNATNNPESRGKSTAPYCTWGEIAEMANTGTVEMISHTQNLHVFSQSGRAGANCAEGEKYESFLPVAQADFSVFNQNLKKHSVQPAVAMSYPYSKRSETADKAWLASGYKLLLGGDDSKERKTQANYFVLGAGVNTKSAVLRRLPRMVNVPVKNYLNAAATHDEG